MAKRDFFFEFYSFFSLHHWINCSAVLSPAQKHAKIYSSKSEMNVTGSDKHLLIVFTAFWSQTKNKLSCNFFLQSSQRESDVADVSRTVQKTFTWTFSLFFSPWSSISVSQIPLPLVLVSLELTLMHVWWKLPSVHHSRTVEKNVVPPWLWCVKPKAAWRHCSSQLWKLLNVGERLFPHSFPDVSRPFVSSSCRFTAATAAAGASQTKDADSRSCLSWSAKLRREIQTAAVHHLINKVLLSSPDLNLLSAC